MEGLPRALVVLGCAIASLGVLLWLGTHLPEGLRPGNLPGDVHIRRDGNNFYFPITTMVVLSLVGSGILWLVGWWRG